MTSLADVAQHLTRFRTAGEAQWKSLVTLSFHYGIRQSDDITRRLADSIGREARVNPKVLRRKLLAIRNAHLAGLTFEEIVAEGQSAIMKSHLKKTAEELSREPEEFIRYRVPVSLKEAWRELQMRIATVCELETSEQLIEFFHSCYVDLSDEELKNLSGGLHAQDKRPNIWKKISAPRLVDRTAQRRDAAR